MTGSIYGAEENYTGEEIALHVKRELVSFRHLPTAATELEAFLVKPFRVRLRWDYGQEEESRSCWVVAVFPDESAVGYSDEGFSFPYYWGRIWPALESFGGDSAWFSSLEDCFLQTEYWTGQLPAGYEVS